VIAHLFLDRSHTVLSLTKCSVHLKQILYIVHLAHFHLNKDWYESILNDLLLFKLAKAFLGYFCSWIFFYQMAIMSSRSLVDCCLRIFIAYSLAYCTLANSTTKCLWHLVDEHFRSTYNWSTRYHSYHNSTFGILCYNAFMHNSVANIAYVYSVFLSNFLGNI